MYPEALIEVEYVPMYVLFLTLLQFTMFFNGNVHIKNLCVEKTDSYGQH